MLCDFLCIFLPFACLIVFSQGNAGGAALATGATFADSATTAGEDSSSASSAGSASAAPAAIPTSLPFLSSSAHSVRRSALFRRPSAAACMLCDFLCIFLPFACLIVLSQGNAGGAALATGATFADSATAAGSASSVAPVAGSFSPAS